MDTDTITLIAAIAFTIVGLGALVRLVGISIDTGYSLCTND